MHQDSKNMIKKNDTTQQAKTQNAPSLIAIDEFLKIRAKNCSAPDVHQTYVQRKHKRRCSDACLNTNTPYKTKFIDNTVSLDPKKIPPGCQYLLNQPLVQAHMSIYRCQVKAHEDSRCRTCNSDAIFEVVKCLYDCYKKKKCNPCNCVMCGYLPKEMRKLSEVDRSSSVSIGVVTPNLSQKTKATMTREEDEIILITQTEIKPEKLPKMTASEKLRIARAFGILTPPESETPHKNGKHTKHMTARPVPWPDGCAPSEKNIYRTNLPEVSVSQRIPSEKLRKARASGLLTPLVGKTSEQKITMLRRLGLNGIPLPEGKTESEKEVIDKVRRELGLPPGPKTVAEKERYIKAQAAGLITPLEGRSTLKKQLILKKLLQNGIPLPEGRTAPEKALIKKIELENLSKTMAKCNTEKKTKGRVRTYVQTLFNKFTTETGYVFLVETPAKDKFCKYQAHSLFTPLEDKEHGKKDRTPYFSQPKKAMLLEKGLLNQVEIGVRLASEPQGEIRTAKVIREMRADLVELGEVQITTERSNRTQSDTRTSNTQVIKIIKPLKEKTTKQKENFLQSTATTGNPLMRVGSSLEYLFTRSVKDNPSAPNVTLEKIKMAEESDLMSSLEILESQKERAVKALVEVGKLIKEQRVPPEKKTMTTLRNRNTLERKGQQRSKTEATKKKVKGYVTNSVTNIKGLEAVVKTGMCKRSVGCDLEKKQFLNRLALPEFITRVERSCLTDSEGIKLTTDRPTSVPSFAITATKVTVNPDTMAQHSTQEFDSLVIDESLISFDIGSQSTDLTTKDLGSKSTGFFYFENNDINDIKCLSHENIYEHNLVENSADVIYIYKSSLDGRGTGKISTKSTQITVLDSYASLISESSSGSFYLIEIGSTDSQDSKLGDPSSVEKVTKDIETATDYFHIQQCKDELSHDICPEPLIKRYLRNNITHSPFLNDAKIYQVCDRNTSHQQRNGRTPQRTKKELILDENCNVLNDSDEYILEDMQIASRQRLPRSSSIYIAISPSRHDVFSSEELDSVIYLEMPDSESKLKTSESLPQEKLQKFALYSTSTCHTRNKQKLVKYLVEQRMPFKCSATRLKPTGHEEYRLPVTEVFTRCPSFNSGTNNQEKRLEFSEKQHTSPKYSENESTGYLKRSKELSFKLSTSIITWSEDTSDAEKQMENSKEQRIEPKYLQIGLSKTGPTNESNVKPGKAISHCLSGGKSASKREESSKCLTDQYSEICLISSIHSSRCKAHPSKVSFYEPCDKVALKYRGTSKEQRMESKHSNVNPESTKRLRRCTVCTGKPCTCCTCDSNGARNPEKQIISNQQMTPNDCSESGFRSDGCTKGYEVRFDQLPTCCPCERKDLTNPEQPIGHTAEKRTNPEQYPSVNKSITQPSSDQQTSTEMRSYTSTACSCHGPEVVKKATSPLTADIKSVGVEPVVDPPTSGNTEEHRTSVVPKNDLIPEGLSNGSQVPITDPEESETFSDSKNIKNSENASNNPADKQMASEDPGYRQRSTESLTESSPANEDATLDQNIPAQSSVVLQLPADLRNILIGAKCSPRCPETVKKSPSHVNDMKSDEIEKPQTSHSAPITQMDTDSHSADSITRPGSDEKLSQQTDLRKGSREKSAAETRPSESKYKNLGRVCWGRMKKVIRIKEQGQSSSNSIKQPQNKASDSVSKKYNLCECPPPLMILKSRIRDDNNVPCQEDSKAPPQKEKLVSDQGQITQRKPVTCSCPDTETMPLTECQKKKLARVQWDKKKYVISECPPPEPSVEDDRNDLECLPSKKKRKRKQGQPKVESSCSHGAIPCSCKDETFCRSRKNHTCECPCPPIVQEIDLLSPLEGSTSQPQPPCQTERTMKPQQKMRIAEYDQGQMTEEKIDKSFCTDGRTRNIGRTKNKASGRGWWARKKDEICSCPLKQPLMVERGCDPPCLKKQWRMRSDETQCKSGFTVKKKPALPQVDDDMCFEDALAYFEQHPEDDPLLKKKKLVECECYEDNKLDSGKNILQFRTKKFSIAGKCYRAIGTTSFSCIDTLQCSCDNYLLYPEWDS